MTPSDAPEDAVALAITELSAQSEVLAALLRTHGPYTPRRSEPLDVFGSLSRSPAFKNCPT